jgi:hypothetical protein
MMAIGDAPRTTKVRLIDQFNAALKQVRSRQFLRPEMLRRNILLAF